MEPSCRCMRDKGVVGHGGSEEGGERAEELGFGLETLCVYGTFGAEVWRMVQATSVLLTP